MSDIVNVLAQLFESIGFGDSASEVRKIAGFLAIIGVSNKREIWLFQEHVQEVFGSMDELDTSFENGCDDPYINLADVLEDLLVIVQSVGIETLAEELGIDISFVKSLQQSS